MEIADNMERWDSIEDLAPILSCSMRSRRKERFHYGSYTLIAYYSDYPIWEKIGTWDGERFHFA